MGKALRRTGKTASKLAYVAIALVLLLGAIGPWTDWQWYSHDLGSTLVPAMAYRWEGLLFISSFLLVWGWFVINFRLSSRQTLVYDPEPLSPQHMPAAMMLRTTERLAPRVQKVLALVLALTSAAGFSSAWPKLLMAINGVNFGRKDPAFGFDLSFFVFRLPWYEELVAGLLWISGAAFILALANYELMRVLSAAANASVAAPQRQRHLYGLAAIFLLVMAVRTEINIWSLVYQPGTQFTGAGRAVWTTVGTRHVIAILMVVAAGGKLRWILDAYVTSDRLPYSSTLDGQSGSINYIRNAAKVVVDAYTGEVTAYATNLEEPITATYAKIYPGAFKSLDAMPTELRGHLRYPEDMLRAQSAILTQYHVSDPRVFLSNSDVWQIANQVGTNGGPEPIKPFYVIIALPGETQATFTLILPFSPSGKPNMSGWIAARMGAQGTSDLKLFRFKGQLPPGPELMESKFASSPDIANINRQFNNDQSEIVVGNSLVIPVGNSFVYAESLFLKSRTAGIQATPRLTKVILALADRIVVKDTYREALAALFSDDGISPAPDRSVPVPAGGTPPPSLVSRKEIEAAADLLDKADAALKSGDFGQYGELQKRARAQLKELLNRR